MPPQKITPNQLLTLLDNLPHDAKIELTKSPGGLMADIPKTKTQIINEKYPHLQGKGITISDAAEKYGVPRGAISKWVYRTNDVRFFDESSYPRLIDEADAALCAEIYHRRQETGLTGVPYFDDDGVPIGGLKHPWLSEYRKRAKQQ